MKKGIIIADITSWAGISLGARHLYCKINYHDENNNEAIHRIKRVATEEIAKDYYGRDGDDTWMYSVGEEIEAFDSEEEIVKHILAFAAEKNIVCHLILRGSSYSLSVMKALHGPEHIVKKINALYEEYEKYCYTRSNKFDSILNRIDDEFHSIVKEYLEPPHE